MKRTLSIAMMAFLGASGWVRAQSPGAAAAPSVTALKAARMFDGRSGEIVSSAVVIVEGSKIREAGSGLAIPPGAAVIDLGDVTLLPGFIDAHQHITVDSGENFLLDFFEGLRRNVAEQSMIASVNARKILEAGFTTVRNVGASDEIDVGLKNAINKGIVPGPRLLVSRYPLGAIGGHCDVTGFPPNLFGPEAGPEKGKLSGAAEARQAVRFQ